MFLELIENAPDERLTILGELKKSYLSGRKIICYGAGVRASVLTEFLKRYSS